MSSRSKVAIAASVVSMSFDVAWDVSSSIPPIDRIRRRIPRLVRASTMLSRSAVDSRRAIWLGHRKDVVLADKS
jgi:hypothetical protein